MSVTLQEDHIKFTEKHVSLHINQDIINTIKIGNKQIKLISNYNSRFCKITLNLYSL